MDSISPFSGKKYLDIPHYIKYFGAKKTFKLGLRINTDMLLEEFIKAWGKNRQSPEWCHIVPAEMQNSSTAIAIGFLQGSSNGQDTVTLNKNISQIIGVKAEVSWQNINDMPVRKKLWDEANKKAEEKAGDHNGTYNNVKAKWSPSALQVYVTKEEDKKKAQKLLLSKFGKVKDNRWPVFVDGSRMKFVPFIPSSSSRQSIKKVEKRLAWHVHSKATEVTFNLDMIDIYECKPYLDNMSLEQVIRGIFSKKIPNIPILKNVVRRWTPIPSQIAYQVSAYAILEEEAEALVKSLKSDLHDLYQDPVLQHFPNDSLLTSYSYGVDRSRGEEADPDIERLLADSDDEEDNVLEPGFAKLLEAQEYGLMGGEDSTIGLSTLGSKDKQSQGDSTVTERTQVDDDRTEESVLTSISWRSDVRNDGKNSAEWVESSRVQRKLNDANITSTAFNEWKEKNKEIVATIVYSAENMYKATKQLINMMKGELDGKLNLGTRSATDNVTDKSERNLIQTTNKEVTGQPEMALDGS